jgi:hypothetical protein
MALLVPHNHWGFLKIIQLEQVPFEVVSIAWMFQGLHEYPFQMNQLLHRQAEDVTIDLLYEPSMKRFLRIYNYTEHLVL